MKRRRFAPRQSQCGIIKERAFTHFSGRSCVQHDGTTRFLEAEDDDDVLDISQSAFGVHPTIGMKMKMALFPLPPFDHSSFQSPQSPHPRRAFFAVLNQDVTSAGRFHFNSGGGRHLHKRQRRVEGRRQPPPSASAAAAHSPRSTRGSQTEPTFVSGLLVGRNRSLPQRSLL